MEFMADSTFAQAVNQNQLRSFLVKAIHNNKACTYTDM